MGASNNVTHEFAGRHLLASYLGCAQERLSDNTQILNTMRAAIEACGASLLSFREHVFPTGGMTAVMLLSESHASIHTYPEFGACFVDIFTCGPTCSPETFDRILRDYLKPSKVTSAVLLRDHNIVTAPARSASRNTGAIDAEIPFVTFGTGSRV